MPRLAAGNETELIQFNAGPVPDVETLIAKWPSLRGRAPPLRLKDAPEEKEQRLAWIINCYGNLYARRRGYDYRRSPLIDTWIIRSADRPDTPLAPWFEGVPDSYRLLIHRAPPLDTSGWSRAHGTWDRVYPNLGIRTGRTTTDDMRTQVCGVLEAMLTEYTTPDGDPEAVLQQLGHPVAYSNAVPYA